MDTVIVSKTEDFQLIRFDAFVSIKKENKSHPSNVEND